MYEYVNDIHFLSRMRSLCGDIMQDLCHTLKEEYDIGASFYLVGSGAKNLIMQNANRPIDLDYNLEITRIDDWEDCRNIKECVRKAFNTVLRKHGWNDCEDSTSSLTTEKRCFTQGNDTDFSIDVCIVCEDVDGNYHRLIHEKTGFSYYDKYFWNQAPNSRRLKEKADYIKSKGKWALVREQYKRIMALMQDYRERIERGEKCDHRGFEQAMYEIVPDHRGDYHMCEELAKGFRDENRWEEVFDNLYGEMPKYSYLKSKEE